MHARILDSIADISTGAWNGLSAELESGQYPFLQHEFLQALEEHDCATPEQGWQPHHLLLLNNDGQMQAAAPLYLKQHSYGEFVFDWSWAEASHHLGRPYYPKLLCAVPFNPVTGPRLLAVSAEARQALVQAILAEARDLGLSSAHALFLNEDDRSAFADAGFMLRRDCHYHWHNRGYNDFEDFLSTLTAERRKKIRRERRRVSESGIRHEVLTGSDVDQKLWKVIYAFYANTYHERGQQPYLSLSCLMELGQQMGAQMRIFLALEQDQPVAAAISFVGGGTLYGRHWGCAAQFHSLHFETCYYQGIEYCIRHGLSHYDAGAQGEHKLHRGFEPVTTWSAHWIADRRLSAAVARSLEHEAALIDSYVASKTPVPRKSAAANTAVGEAD